MPHRKAGAAAVSGRDDDDEATARAVPHTDPRPARPEGPPAVTAVEDRADSAAVPATPEKPGRRRKLNQRDKYNKREAMAGYLFIAPWVIGFLIFTLGAMIYSLVISFSNYDLATDTANFNGGDNYARLFEDPRVMLALGNSLYYAIMAVPL